jgi:hypothetical protein
MDFPVIFLTPGVLGPDIRSEKDREYGEVTDAIPCQMACTRFQLGHIIGKATVASRCAGVDYSKMFIAILASIRGRDMGAQIEIAHDGGRKTSATPF